MFWLSCCIFVGRWDGCVSGIGSRGIDGGFPSAVFCLLIVRSTFEVFPMRATQPLLMFPSPFFRKHLANKTSTMTISTSEIPIPMPIMAFLDKPEAFVLEPEQEPDVELKGMKSECPALGTS